MKVEKADIIKSIKNFEVAPHRMQLIASKNNIKYVDDSKSTNVHSSMNALSVVKDRVVLLLGGEDKSLNFAPIFEKHRQTQSCTRTHIRQGAQLYA